MRPPEPPRQSSQRPLPDAGDTTATDWPSRVHDALGGVVSVVLPGFGLRTLLPTPDAFDDPIRSLESTAATFETMGGDLDGVLAGVRWEGNDATRFRQQFAGTRVPQLTARGRDLRELAGELRRIQARTADEIDWIRAIVRDVRDFLARIQAAFHAARAAAEEALADAEAMRESATSALGNLLEAGSELVRANVEIATGGDPRDELERAARHAEAAVGDARRTLDATVDFTTNWTFNGANLPDGVCRAWYDVDTFMARMSGTAEAYGATYAARGPFPQ